MAVVIAVTVHSVAPAVFCVYSIAYTGLAQSVVSTGRLVLDSVLQGFGMRAHCSTGF